MSFFFNKSWKLVPFLQRESNQSPEAFWFSRGQAGETLSGPRLKLLLYSQCACCQNHCQFWFGRAREHHQMRLRRDLIPWACTARGQWSAAKGSWLWAPTLQLRRVEWLLAAFRRRALYGKHKRASVLRMFLMFVSFCFLLNVFQSLSEFWCLIKSCCIMHNALSPKTNKQTKTPIFSVNTTCPTWTPLGMLV